MKDRQPRLVFDCNVFAQALINKFGAAGQCYREAQTGEAALFVSAEILSEIVELHLKQPARYGVRAEDCQACISAGIRLNDITRLVFSRGLVNCLRATTGG